MQLLPQIVFFAFLAAAVWLFTKNIVQIRRNIFLGRKEDFTDNKPKRWNNLLLLALGQSP